MQIRIGIELIHIDDDLEMTITDDGKGFDVANSRETSKGLGLVSITERARTSADPGDADALSQELSTIAIELAGLGYERRSSYEQFAPAQLAFESTQAAVEALRARSPARAKVDLSEGAALYATRTGAS